MDANYAHELQTRITRMTRIPSDASLRDAGVERLPASPVTGAIIGAFYDAYNELGYGFLERVYGAALAILLKERGYHVRREVPCEVVFHGRVIGIYRADFIVDDRVVVETKTGAVLSPASKAQLVNYLRIARIEVGLLLFFGPEPSFKRVVFSGRRN